MNQTNCSLLEAFVRIAPSLHKLMQDDISISVYDTEKLLIYVPAKTFNLNLTPGELLVDGDILSEAITEDKEMSAIVPKEIFGVPFASKVIPLHDEHSNVIGGVGVATSIEKANNLFEVSESLNAIVQETAASLEEITVSASNLAERIEDVSNHLKEAGTGTNQIGQISKVVKGLSDQSNLLGLNAAIEAARAGDAGKGFSVVADEIRKLAANSKENVSQIDDITKGIREAIDNLNNAFEGITDFADLQVTSIQQITEIVQDIGKNAQRLSMMADHR